MDTLTTASVETENLNTNEVDETELPNSENTEEAEDTEDEVKAEGKSKGESINERPKSGQTAKTLLKVAELLKMGMSVSIMDTTAQTVAQKLKNSFKRIKGFWDDTNRAIRRGEKKMEKLNEQMFELREERENLENELEGIRNTYQTFCEQAGINADLN